VEKPLQRQDPSLEERDIQTESLEDPDEELGDYDERKGRKEVIPSVFTNSRNIQDKSLLSYN
jgi:hypothetical protein